MSYEKKRKEIIEKNDIFKDLNIKPGDVKYLYVVLSDEGYQQEIAKGIYLSKEKDSYNATWYTFSIMAEDTIITSSLPYFIFDTKEQIEAFVKKYEAQFNQKDPGVWGNIVDDEVWGNI
jgi:hypothetical protein